MSIINNAFQLSNCSLSISRHDTHIYNCGRLDGTMAYPLCQDILSCVSAEAGASDSLEECYNRDALFGFAIRSHLDLTARSSRISKDRILSRILNIGLYDWTGRDQQGGGKQPPIPICYAAVLGMQLWKRIDVLSDRVSNLQAESGRSWFPAAHLRVVKLAFQRV